MAYVPVPKDLTKIKSKVAFNLTKRQLICFGGGALTGVPLFFLCRGSLGTSTAALMMVLTMLPFFFLAMYERNGQPLEKVVRQFVRLYFLRPKKRPYKTNNFYAALARQDQLDREVYRIVQGKKTDARQGRDGKRPPQADPRRAPGDRRGHPQGGPDR